MVPGSMVRSRLRQSTPSQFPFCCTSAGANSQAKVEMTRTSAADASPSRPTSAGVPRAIMLSNPYRARARQPGLLRLVALGMVDGLALTAICIASAQNPES